MEEYNVTVDEFVYVLSKELRESVAETVLSNEVLIQFLLNVFIIMVQLLMLKKLKFHLIVHSPFRPLEGFIIDMKVNI